MNNAQCFRCFRPIDEHEDRWVSDDMVPRDGHSEPDDYKPVTLCDSCHKFVTMPLNVPQLMKDQIVGGRHE